MGNSHSNFQLHRFTISENIAKRFRGEATFFDSHCTVLIISAFVFEKMTTTKSIHIAHCHKPLKLQLKTSLSSDRNRSCFPSVLIRVLHENALSPIPIPKSCLPLCLVLAVPPVHSQSCPIPTSNYTLIHLLRTNKTTHCSFNATHVINAVVW